MEEEKKEEIVVQAQTFEGAEDEAVVLYSSNSATLPELYSSLTKELDKRTNNVPDILRAQVKDQLFETLLWEYIKQVPVPLEVIKTRVGADGKEYEYFDEHYTISELDRLFPGWWQDEMITRYDPQSQAYITSGYLCVEYLLPSGQKKIRKIYVTGGAQVHAKKNEKEQGNLVPSQPEDRAIASVTRWQKLAGKKLGIGVEIYHQRITPQLTSQFFEIVNLWRPPFANKHIEVFNKMQKGKGVRDLLKSMPSLEQTKRLVDILSQIPADDPVYDFDAVWKFFVSCNRESAEKALPQINKQVNGRLKKIEEAKLNNIYQ